MFWYIYICTYINLYIYIMYYHMLSYVITFDHTFIMFYHMLSYLIIRLLLFIICHHILLCVYHMFIMCLSKVIICYHSSSYFIIHIAFIVFHGMSSCSMAFRHVSVGLSGPRWANLSGLSHGWSTWIFLETFHEILEWGICLDCTWIASSKFFHTWCAISWSEWHGVSCVFSGDFCFPAMDSGMRRSMASPSDVSSQALSPERVAPEGLSVNMESIRVNRPTKRKETY